MISGGCSPLQNFNRNVRSIVKPYRFSAFTWEIKVLPGEIKQWFINNRNEDANESQTVITYFSIIDNIKSLQSRIKSVKSGKSTEDIASLNYQLNTFERQRDASVKTVEGIIINQITKTLKEQGIFSSRKYVIDFPPVSFNMESPPYLLVISPRDRIESIKEVTLIQDIITEKMEYIEKEIDSMGVSSLVVELGGYAGTYPTFVVNNAGLKFTVDTAIEEWLHQYLVFRPLGFRYLLDVTGIARNYEIATINETVASMVSREIGSMILNKYYLSENSVRRENSANDTKFDFNKEMREIRLMVDSCLERGEIEQAENYMEQKRRYLAENGYYIRKLNQAYFAFHGTYADRPTSVSPIGVELRELRASCASLKEFLDKVSAMTSREDLKVSLK